MTRSDVLLINESATPLDDLSGYTVDQMDDAVAEAITAEKTAAKQLQAEAYRRVLSETDKCIRADREQLRQIRKEGERRAKGLKALHKARCFAVKKGGSFIPLLVAMRSTTRAEAEENGRWPEAYDAYVPPKPKNGNGKG